MLKTIEELDNSHKGIRASPTIKVEGSIPQLKCIYTNSCSMGSKQEELEVIAQMKTYDIIAVMKTWWDDSELECFNGWL